MLGLCWVEAIGWRQTGALAKVGIRGRAKCGEKQGWKGFVCQQVMDGH